MVAGVSYSGICKGCEIPPGASAREIATPVIKGCGAYFECRSIYKEDICIDKLPPELQKACYPSGDTHRLYFGEILSCYKAE